MINDKVKEIEHRSIIRVLFVHIRNTFYCLNKTTNKQKDQDLQIALPLFLQLTYA